MKKKRYLTMVPLFLTIILFLSGCVRRTAEGKPYGFVYEKMAVPTQNLLEWISNLLGGNGNSYGWAIIIITLIVRLCLLPLMLGQMKKSTIQQEKMGRIRPQMQAIQERQKQAQTPEERAAISQEMMALYQANGISMTGGIGCLPILIQMPIFAALYAAIQYSTELVKTNFYGINLGSRSFTFVLLTFAIYMLQAWLSMQGIPEEQKQQMKSMMFLTPIMTATFTFASPAGLGLYFFVGGIIACLQTLLVNAMRPRIRREIEEEMKKNPPKPVATPARTEIKATEKTVTETTTKNSVHPKQNQRRNAGKQNRR